MSSTHGGSNDAAGCGVQLTCAGQCWAAVWRRLLAVGFSMTLETYSSVRSAAVALDSVQLVAVRGRSGLFQCSLLVARCWMVRRQTLASRVTMLLYMYGFVPVCGVSQLSKCPRVCCVDGISQQHAMPQQTFLPHDCLAACSAIEPGMDPCIVLITPQQCSLHVLHVLDAHCTATDAVSSNMLPSLHRAMGHGAGQQRRIVRKL